MAHTLRRINSYRFTYSLRRYCEEKSIYQKHEEGIKPRLVHGKEYPTWRKKWTERDGEWQTKFSVFVEKNVNPDLLAIMQGIPDLTMDQIKEWWKKVKVIQEVQNQVYLPERNAALGSNLAAVHFITYRGAAVRLKGSKEWIQGDIEKLLDILPINYVDGYMVEAIDCQKFHGNGIRYEGIANFGGLNYLKWLSLRNNKFVDVWCLDRLAGQNGKSLEYLDISGCRLCEGCIYALSRMKRLKTLVISDPGENLEIQAGLSLLEENNKLLILTEEVINNETITESKSI